MGPKSYIVKLKTVLDSTECRAFCKNEQELSLLLTHIDKKIYDIESIQAVGIVDDFKIYCKKESFETGKTT